MVWIHFERWGSGGGGGDGDGGIGSGKRHSTVRTWRLVLRVHGVIFMYVKSTSKHAVNNNSLASIGGNIQQHPKPKLHNTLATAKRRPNWWERAGTVKRKPIICSISSPVHTAFNVLCCFHDIVSLLIQYYIFFVAATATTAVVFLLFASLLLLSAPLISPYLLLCERTNERMYMNWRASKNKMAIQVPNEICFSAQRTISCVFIRSYCKA